MAMADAKVRPRFKDRYDAEIRPMLIERFGYKSPMQTPRLEKITVNMGVGDAKQDTNVLEAAIEQLGTITGQRPNIRKARPMKDSSRMGQTQVQPGGVFDLASPLAVSKVMIVCPTCGRASRVGYEFREDEKGRRVKVRVCKRDGCGEVLDR